MSRFPIRLRLTLAFALAMAVLLAGTGAFLYLRLASSLDVAIDEGLEARAVDITALLARGAGTLSGTPEGTLADPDERFVQVLDGAAVVDATPQVGGQPLLGPAEVEQALAEEEFWVEREDVSGIAGRARMLATPIERVDSGTDGKLLLIVGASLEERDDTLSGLLGQLLVVGPAALALASLLAYALARAALRPVDSMRAEAAAISGTEPGRRLPLPQSRDEVRRLGETLNAMLARLETALERERSFVADASHELRTPVALLRTELELALRRPRSPAQLEQALRSAAEEAEHLSHLAEQLLVLARSDQRRLPLRPGPVRVVGLLSEVAERFRPEAERARRALEVVSPDGLELVGDADRLAQAVGNLVENALRHGRGAICVSALEENGRVELHVADEGAGFPPAFVSRAFERFTSADEARSGQGAGLGLAIVAAIAAAHGGSAHAANRDEGGADVWVSVPSA